ncbi:MAG: acetylglutamate kinase [Bacteroidota bacterium]
MSKPILNVIKVGGNVLDDATQLDQFLKDFAQVPGAKILVHGGGKIATTLGNHLGIAANYHQGRRITDKATLDLVTMVYGGLVNKQLVAGLQALNCNAIGLTGADGNIIPAAKRPVKTIDYGFVGDVQSEKINSSLLNQFLQLQIVPILAPLTHDLEGSILNTNADTIASAIAIALSEQWQVRLIYCFEKKGVLLDVNDEESVVRLISPAVYQQLLAENRIADGILPKLENAFAAINSGVHEVLIGHANDVIANTGQQTKGTLIAA